MRTTVAGNAILARYPALTAAVHVKPLTFKELPGAYSMQPWARKVAPVATVVKWPLVTLSSRDPPRKSHRSQMGASMNGGTPKWMIYREIPIKMDLGVLLFQETCVSRHSIDAAQDKLAVLTC